MVHAVNRMPVLIDQMGGASAWELRYEEGTLTGVVAGSGTYRNELDEASGRLSELLDELAALVVGDPGLAIEIGISAAVFDNAAANTELAKARGVTARNALIRAGVDPSRIRTLIGDDEGEVLRFVVAVAEP